ncbi:MAG: class I SAM-dependent methyltransferase [Helicobacteraceae bacterium]
MKNLQQRGGGQSTLYKTEWDYTKHAAFYSYRPNYSPKAIDLLCEWAFGGGKGVKGSGSAADLGAGTANLTLMLLERGLKVSAVEPNDAMREIGIERTKGKDATWYKAGATETTLDDASFDLVTFGSSFNVVDRELALKETARILKPRGCFACMWNHRDLDDPIQETAQEVIKDLLPNYSGGVRREDQKPFLLTQRALFDEICFIEQDFYFRQSRENYIKAWQSVKNPYWDLSTEEGRALFGKIAYKLEHSLPLEFDIKYTTRMWMAKKV